MLCSGGRMIWCSGVTVSSLYFVPFVHTTFTLFLFVTDILFYWLKKQLAQLSFKRSP